MLLRIATAIMTMMVVLIDDDVDDADDDDDDVQRPGNMFLRSRQSMCMPKIPQESWNSRSEDIAWQYTSLIASLQKCWYRSLFSRHAKAWGLRWTSTR
eukprot:4755982-Amphidinium_carterae.1